MQLSRRQWRALEAICDTFAPGENGMPSASAIGVPRALVDAVALNPREAERRQTSQLLSLWDTRLLPALAGGGLGSGAAGGTAAGVRAAAGLDVVVLEAGDYYDDEDFDGGEYDGYSRLYLNGGGLPSTDQSVGLLAGMCLGGGTTVNYTTSF